MTTKYRYSPSNALSALNTRINDDSEGFRDKKLASFCCTWRFKRSFEATSLFVARFQIFNVWFRQTTKTYVWSDVVAIALGTFWSRFRPLYLTGEGACQRTRPRIEEPQVRSSKVRGDQFEPRSHNQFPHPDQKPMFRKRNNTVIARPPGQPQKRPVVQRNKQLQRTASMKPMGIRKGQRRRNTRLAPL